MSVTFKISIVKLHHLKYHNHFHYVIRCVRRRVFMWLCRNAILVIYPFIHEWLIHVCNRLQFAFLHVVAAAAVTADAKILSSKSFFADEKPFSTFAPLIVFNILHVDVFMLWFTHDFNILIHLSFSIQLNSLNNFSVNGHLITSNCQCLPFCIETKPSSPSCSVWRIHTHT